MRLWNKVVQLLLALFICVFFSSTSFGQINPGRTYFDSNKRDCDSIHAVGYRQIVYSFEGPKTIQTVQSYRMNGTLASESIHDQSLFPYKYSMRKLYDSLARLNEIQQLYLNNIEGPFEKFYPNGALKAKGSYHLNNYDDTLIGYYPNGAWKRIDVFCNGKLIEGKCFGTNGKDTTYFPFFQQASFPGELKDFNQYLMNNMKYPQVALENNIQGSCYIKFLVHPDGSISNATLVRGIPGCPECDLEALRLIKKMPNWVPAIDDEQLANLTSYYQLSINFRLE
jgi:TonB family protein